ncbi:MAG: SGNH/GDSL hydrolase family protein [Planctomycetales bacterium]|nr:SGNH/GDSL hydrolase family protein [Planctomycetales bacterium]
MPITTSRNRVSSGWWQLVLLSFVLGSEQVCVAQNPPTEISLGPYEYETKPEDPAFEKFNPAKAPSVGALLLRSGDKLAICGDSITEQKMYSRIMETYLTVCYPELQITCRQYGWSGEKTDGFLRRMDNDCLRFEPTIATLCYGMNDARYRPFDITNGNWYRDHYTAIVRKFQSADVRVVLGSPGASGRLATWVKSRSGDLDEHNLNLCALRDIAIEVAKNEHCAFADIFWPMYQAQVFGDQRFSTDAEKYEVAGKDGIHPGWAGQLIMAYAMLRAMGIDGNLGEFEVDLQAKTATAQHGHEVQDFDGQTLRIKSNKYPFCAVGPDDKDSSLRSGMQLVPFNDHLNRLTLRITNLVSQQAKIRWGNTSLTFSKEELAAGINLAERFHQNPFSEAFNRVDEAVYAKQAYETEQIKREFHGPEARKDIEKVVRDTEAKRTPLAAAIQSAMQPIEHELEIVPL